MAAAHVIVLGRLVTPYGVRGWFNLHAFADDPDSWCSLPQWWVASNADAAQPEWRTFQLEEVRTHGKGLIAKLVGVDDRSAAEALQGSYVGAPRDAMPATATDEFYWDDLVGLEVKNGKGESLGKVESIISAAANDVLVVCEGEVKRLLPFVNGVVGQIDAVAGVIQVEWERDW